MKIGIDRPSGLGVYTVNLVNELYRLHQDMVAAKGNRKAVLLLSWSDRRKGFDIAQSVIGRLLFAAEHSPSKSLDEYASFIARLVPDSGRC